MGEIRIDFMDSDGKLKSKDQFVKEMEELYNQVSDTVPANEFIRLLSGPLNDFHPGEVLEKYHFIDRKIYINGEINPDMARDVLEKIQIWNAEDEFNGTPEDKRNPIQVFINSNGGCLYSSLQIIDTIQRSLTPVVTIVTGTAFSGAFFITIAGHVRLAFPHASFMCHQGSALFTGDAHKLIQQVDDYKKSLKMIKKHVLANTKIPAELYKKHEPDDWYMYVDDALKYGIIDKITSGVNGEIELSELEGIDDEE